MAERVLVLLKPQFLGDAVMACPLIDSLRDAGREVLVMCGPTVEELLQDRGPEVRFTRGEKISGIGPVLRAARAIRELRVDAAYLVNRSFRSALAMRLAGVKRRIGHATEGRSFLLTSSVPYRPSGFEAECYLDLLAPEGLPAADSKPRLSAPPVESNYDFGIQPGARYIEKQLPTSVSAEIAESLLSQGRRGVILGGAEESEAAVRFESALSRRAEVLAGKLTIRQTMGVLAGLKAMIGSDTGLMHVAAALGCPTVTVFGPNPAAKWGHRYPPHAVLEAPGGRMERMQSAPILAAAERAIAGEAANAQLGKL